MQHMILKKKTTQRTQENLHQRGEFRLGRELLAQISATRREIMSRVRCGESRLICQTQLLSIAIQL